MTSAPIHELDSLRLPADRLEVLVARIFAAAGSNPKEAASIGRHLVSSNLAGHESHGVIRVSAYVAWLGEGLVVANREGRIVQDSGALVVLDGEGGFGQAIGERIVAIGVERARAHGVGLVAVRDCGHLGRIGGWAELAAEAGMASLHFVNSGGLEAAQVAPFGGRERRLPPNPLAIAVPRPDAPPILLDITTSVVPEGKVRVALNRGALLPEGAMIDADGRPSRDPKAYYGPPVGALLPIAGHKGYGLCVMVDLLAGALTGGGCADPRRPSRGNNMLSVFIDPAHLGVADQLDTSVADLADWVKSSAPIREGAEILMPGDYEARCRAERLVHGVPLDPTTWGQIEATARRLGVDPTSALEA